MKGRLYTNMILSFTSLTFFILAMWTAANLDTRPDTFGYSEYARNSKFSIFVLFIILAVLNGIANIVMGIVTLSLPKKDGVRGLTIASGILAILNGTYGSGFIVSLIAIILFDKKEGKEAIVEIKE